jgi:hypothetical protein
MSSPAAKSAVARCKERPFICIRPQRVARNGRWIADQEGAFRATHRVELLTRWSRPTPEMDRLGTGGCGRQDDCWRRVRKFGTVLFAHAEDAEPNAIFMRFRGPKALNDKLPARQIRHYFRRIDGKWQATSYRPTYQNRSSGPQFSGCRRLTQHLALRSATSARIGLRHRFSATPVHYRTAPRRRGGDNHRARACNTASGQGEVQEGQS